DKYQTDAYQWVCSRPSLHESWFPICKHLVQSVVTVPTSFFWELTRYRTAPLWRQLDLVDLDGRVVGERLEGADGAERSSFERGQTVNEELDDDDELETEFRVGLQSYQEEIRAKFDQLTNLAEGLRVQIQFNDSRILATLEREGERMFRLMENFDDREIRYNLVRVPAPDTWKKSMARAMWWRPRPRRDSRGREEASSGELVDVALLPFAKMLAEHEFARQDVCARNP
ncbi:hypothetical protein DL96DRAFT_1475596, partial [Flagelloscypha sp. PMI_526]